MKFSQKYYYQFFLHNYNKLLPLAKLSLKALTQDQLIMNDLYFETLHAISSSIGRLLIVCVIFPGHNSNIRIRPLNFSTEHKNMLSNLHAQEIVLQEKGQVLSVEGRKLN
jgi:hypothetical protein